MQVDETAKAAWARRAIYPLYCALLLGCGEPSPQLTSEADATADSATVAVANTSTAQITLDPVLDEPVRNLLQAYLSRIDEDFIELNARLNDLKEQIGRFLQGPTVATMNGVRSSWLQAHTSYEIMALHRYMGDLILSETEALRWYELNYQLNHWPILPGYIDYVGGYSESGIVNDINVALDLPTLRDQHGTFDLAEASVGFHVMEFLLWGENPAGLSPRPATDYQPMLTLDSSQLDSGLTATQLPNNRRRVLLELLSAALIEDASASQSLWRENSAGLSSQLADMAGVDALVLMVEAMTAMLTEELLLRSLYPLLNDEFDQGIPSPFSHSSQNVIAAQLSAVDGLLTLDAGDGTTLDGILAELSDDYADLFFQNFALSKECLVLLYSNFDTEAQSSNQTAEFEFEIVECINLLTNMVDNLEQVKVSLYSAD